jgi:hypothetical protein
MDLFELVHDCPLRARGEIVFERFNARVGSFGERFYRPIRTVANVTDNLMPRRSALREKNDNPRPALRHVSKTFAQLPPPYSPRKLDLIYT